MNIKKRSAALIANRKAPRIRGSQKIVASTTVSQGKNLPKNPKQKIPIANKEFLVVGMGASAGGLEAISQVLANLPPDLGIAFIIVQHLDPTHGSMTVEILSRQTPLTVLEIKEGMRIKPNHIYVIPPNHNLQILHGVLKLLPRAPVKGQYLPIDAFFQSLAEDQKYKAVGVVLSGTASDGTYGLSAIKAEGGLTIAQDPKTAKYDGMPRSAIASGAVDLILSPNQIAETLIRIGQHPLLLHREPRLKLSADNIPDKGEKDDLLKVLTLLRTQCHVDFSRYKHSTLKRRIARRMVLQKQETFKDYLKYLQANLDESRALFADMLINVTEFFRDPDAFAELKTHIFPAIMKNKAANSPFRIWVIGCSTGEEAYSVAMSLMEYMDECPSKNPIQIFATDVSESVIQKARAGIYPESISKNVSEERLKRFFVKTDAGYKVKTFLREVCLFSWHDVTRDPPFAKLDLLCCRNLLIYFDTTLQKYVLSVFHYALNPGGFLWLGSSENVGSSSSIFHLVDKTNKFYSRKLASVTPKFQFPTGTYVPEKLESVAKPPSERLYNSTNIEREINRIVSLKYAPPGLVVNGEMEIVFIRGDITPYLHLMPGQASFNLFKMIRTEIASDLRMTIQVAKQKNMPARKDGLKLRLGEHLRTFNLDITPLAVSPLIDERYFLISFESSMDVSPIEKAAIATKEQGKKPIDSRDWRNRELEQELNEAKMYQHSLIQDFEATQEELTSANEELQSTNEELQSTNEELETAKEELQSANEELTTLNDELHNRNADLVYLNNDLINLLSCVDIPIVMIGVDGRIRRFTPKASKVMNLIPSDIGRPISDFKPRIEMPNLEQFVSEVIDTVTTKEIDVQDQAGHWFRLQARPYKTVDNRIDGAVIVMMDINALKHDLKEKRTALDYATSIANTVQLPLVVLDNKLCLKSANVAFYEKFPTIMKGEGADLLTLLGEASETISDPLRKKLKEVLISNVELKNFEIKGKFSNAEQQFMLLTARRIQWVGEESEALLLSILDITDRHNMEVALKEAVTAAEKANRAKDIFLTVLSHELRTPLTNILSWAQLLLKTEQSPEKIKHGLKIIEQNALTQGQLIDDLLEISRIQSGKITLNISELDPSDSIQRAIESVNLLAKNKSVVIETHLAQLNGKVAADSARLQQVIWNLLTNAIKFSPVNGVINVYLSPVKEQKQRFASIKIIDQGEGIPPAFLPHIFERFTQADSTATRAHGGLGMGLAIVHDLLKLLGGTIEAKNNEGGKGATFTVLLPLIPNGTKQKAQVQTKASSQKVAEEEVALRQELNGLSILIVENEQSSLDAVTELLNSAGAKTIPAISVAEALNAFDKYKPDILVSDIAMPEEDGYTLIRKIRARDPEQGGQTPAVALTAYATRKDIKQARSAGFNAHLAKPFNAVDLFRVIAEVAKRKQ